MIRPLDVGEMPDPSEWIDILFVGVAPTAQEGRYAGAHFYSSEDDLLRRNLFSLLSEAEFGVPLLGLRLEEGNRRFHAAGCFFVHAAKVRPVRAQAPAREVIRFCARRHLRDEIPILGPRAVCFLGRKNAGHAAAALFGRPIGDMVETVRLGGWSGLAVVTHQPRRGWLPKTRAALRELWRGRRGPAPEGVDEGASHSRVLRPYLLVGLTGGIASGKSTVSRQLAELGCRVIDADALAREVVAPGQPAWRQIVEVFGGEILRPDTTLDRARLGAVVFADPDTRRRLEAITHPAIQARRQAALDELAAGGFDGIVVQDVALLIEVGGAANVDRLVVVYATPEVQRERLMRRDGLAAAEAEHRLASQMPLAEKVPLAHYVIDNSDTPEETAAQVRAVHAALVAEHRARPRTGG